MKGQIHCFTKKLSNSTVDTQQFTFQKPSNSLEKHYDSNLKDQNYNSLKQTNIQNKDHQHIKQFNTKQNPYSLLEKLGSNTKKSRQNKQTLGFSNTQPARTQRNQYSMSPTIIDDQKTQQSQHSTQKFQEIEKTMLKNYGPVLNRKTNYQQAPVMSLNKELKKNDSANRSHLLEKLVSIREKYQSNDPQAQKQNTKQHNQKIFSGSNRNYSQEQIPEREAKYQSGQHLLLLKGKMNKQAEKSQEKQLKNNQEDMANYLHQKFNQFTSSQHRSDSNGSLKKSNSSLKRLSECRDIQNLMNSQQRNRSSKYTSQSSVRYQDSHSQESLSNDLEQFLQNNLPNKKIDNCLQCQEQKKKPQNIVKQRPQLFMSKQNKRYEDDYSDSISQEREANVYSRKGKEYYHNKLNIDKKNFHEDILENQELRPNSQLNQKSKSIKDKLEYQALTERKAKNQLQQTQENSSKHQKRKSCEISFSSQINPLHVDLAQESGISASQERSYHPFQRMKTLPKGESNYNPVTLNNSVFYRSLPREKPDWESKSCIGDRSFYTDYINRSQMNEGESMLNYSSFGDNRRGYSFCRQQRQLQDSNFNPGPGQYKIQKDFVKPNSLQYKIGHSQRSLNLLRRTPNHLGPGYYEAPTLLKNKALEFVKMSVDKEVVNDNPGPGTYDINLCNSDRGKVSIGNSKREDIVGRNKLIPGPGQYNIQDGLEPKGYSFGRSNGKEQDIPNSTPGPGAYQNESYQNKNQKSAPILSKKDSPERNTKQQDLGPGQYEIPSSFGNKGYSFRKYEPKEKIPEQQYIPKQRTNEDLIKQLNQRIEQSERIYREKFQNSFKEDQNMASGKKDNNKVQKQINELDNKNIQKKDQSETKQKQVEDPMPKVHKLREKQFSFGKNSREGSSKNSKQEIDINKQEYQKQSTLEKQKFIERQDSKETKQEHSKFQPILDPQRQRSIQNSQDRKTVNHNQEVKNHKNKEQNPKSYEQDAKQQHPFMLTQNQFQHKQQMAKLLIKKTPSFARSPGENDNERSLAENETPVNLYGQALLDTISQLYELERLKAMSKEISQQKLEQSLQEKPQKIKEQVCQHCQKQEQQQFPPQDENVILRDNQRRVKYDKSRSRSREIEEIKEQQQVSNRQQFLKKYQNNNKRSENKFKREKDKEIQNQQLKEIQSRYINKKKENPPQEKIEQVKNDKDTAYVSAKSNFLEILQQKKEIPRRISSQSSKQSKSSDNPKNNQQNHINKTSRQQKRSLRQTPSQDKPSSTDSKKPILSSNDSKKPKISQVQIFDRLYKQELRQPYSYRNQKQKEISPLKLQNHDTIAKKPLVKSKMTRNIPQESIKQNQKEKGDIINIKIKEEEEIDNSKKEEMKQFTNQDQIKMIEQILKSRGIRQRRTKSLPQPPNTSYAENMGSSFNQSLVGKEQEQSDQRQESEQRSIQESSEKLKEVKNPKQIEDGQNQNEQNKLNQQMRQQNGYFYLNRNSAAPPQQPVKEKIDPNYQGLTMRKQSSTISQAHMPSPFLHDPQVNNMLSFSSLNNQNIKYQPVLIQKQFQQQQQLKQQTLRDQAKQLEQERKEQEQKQTPQSNRYQVMIIKQLSQNLNQDQIPRNKSPIHQYESRKRHLSPYDSQRRQQNSSSSGSQRPVNIIIDHKHIPIKDSPTKKLEIQKQRAYQLLEREQPKSQPYNKEEHLSKLQNDENLKEEDLNLKKRDRFQQINQQLSNIIDMDSKKKKQQLKKVEVLSLNLDSSDEDSNEIIQDQNYRQDSQNVYQQYQNFPTKDQNGRKYNSTQDNVNRQKQNEKNNQSPNSQKQRNYPSPPNRREAFQTHKSQVFTLMGSYLDIIEEDPEIMGQDILNLSKEKNQITKQEQPQRGNSRSRARNFHKINSYSPTKLGKGTNQEEINFKQLTPIGQDKYNLKDEKSQTQIYKNKPQQSPFTSNLSPIFDPKDKFQNRIKDYSTNQQKNWSQHHQRSKSDEDFFILEDDPEKQNQNIFSYDKQKKESTVTKPINQRESQSENKTPMYLISRGVYRLPRASFKDQSQEVPQSEAKKQNQIQNQLQQDQDEQLDIRITHESQNPEFDEDEQLHSEYLQNRKIQIDKIEKLPSYMMPQKQYTGQSRNSAQYLPKSKSQQANYEVQIRSINNRPAGNEFQHKKSNSRSFSNTQQQRNPPLQNSRSTVSLQDNRNIIQSREKLGNYNYFVPSQQKEIKKKSYQSQQQLKNPFDDDYYKELKKLNEELKQRKADRNKNSGFQNSFAKTMTLKKPVFDDDDEFDFKMIKSVSQNNGQENGIDNKNE